MLCKFYICLGVITPMKYLDMVEISKTETGLENIIINGIVKDSLSKGFVRGVTEENHYDDDYSRNLRAFFVEKDYKKLDDLAKETAIRVLSNINESLSRIDSIPQNNFCLKFIKQMSSIAFLTSLGLYFVVPYISYESDTDKLAYISICTGLFYLLSTFGINHNENVIEVSRLYRTFYTDARQNISVENIKMVFDDNNFSLSIRKHIHNLENPQIIE